MERINASCECAIPGFKKIPPPPPLPFFFQEQYLNEISAIRPSTENRMDLKNESLENCHLCHWASQLDSRFLSEMLDSLNAGNNFLKYIYNWLSIFQLGPLSRY